MAKEREQRICSYCGLIRRKFFRKRRTLLSGRTKVGRQNCCTDCARDRQFFRYCLETGFASVLKRINRDEEKLRMMQYYMRHRDDTETKLLLGFKQERKREGSTDA